MAKVNLREPQAFNGPCTGEGRMELRVKVAGIVEGCIITQCDCGCNQWLRNGDVSNPFKLSALPDYCNNLNAIHEAERAAFPDSAGDLLLNDWAYNLYMECRANAEDKDVSLARATAEQRCRAFVATMENGELPSLNLQIEEQTNERTDRS